jgi:hypothetical protein
VLIVFLSKPISGSFFILRVTVEAPEPDFCTPLSVQWLWGSKEIEKRALKFLLWMVELFYVGVDTNTAVCPSRFHLSCASLGSL